MTENRINEEMLAAYLRGELDAAEAAAVEAWYDASPANRKQLAEVYYILFVNDRIEATAGIDVERSLRACKRRMQARQRRPIRRIVWRAAAAAVVAIALLTGGVTTWRTAERLTRPVVVSTQLGERSQVVLPDGTKVWLNSCSRVEYSASLFRRQRRVEMDGEAYFEVAHDAHAPFTVTTNGLDIKVLGTRFNIRNDDEMHRITTALLDGSIRALAKGKTSASVRLRPAQQLVFDTETGDMHLTDCPAVEQSINWIDGRFHFEHNTFGEIVTELKRYYNIDVTFRDESLRNECFSGDFRVEDGIYHIMSVLQLTYKFTYKVSGNNIEVYANTHK